MNEKSIIHLKSYSFSIRIVRLYQYLIKEHKEYSLAKQILRSGTSIGANIEEATGGHSKKNFYQNYLYHIAKPENHIIG